MAILSDHGPARQFLRLQKSHRACLWTVAPDRSPRACTRSAHRAGAWHAGSDNLTTMIDHPSYPSGLEW